MKFFQILRFQEGIGITTNDGQTLDVEKSADFGFDRTLDGQQLASIWEGIESGSNWWHCSMSWERCETPIGNVVCINHT